MKISVNDNVIETTEINKISNITNVDNMTSLYFNIEFLNKTTLKVNHKSRTGFYSVCWAEISNCIFYNEDGSVNREIKAIGTIEDCLNSDEYKESWKEINNVRSEIINIWLENQVHLPMFNLIECYDKI